MTTHWGHSGCSTPGCSGIPTFSAGHSRPGFSGWWRTRGDGVWARKLLEVNKKPRNLKYCRHQPTRFNHNWHYHHYCGSDTITIIREARSENLQKFIWFVRSGFPKQHLLIVLDLPHHHHHHGSSHDLHDLEAIISIIALLDFCDLKRVNGQTSCLL